MGSPSEQREWRIPDNEPTRTYEALIKVSNFAGERALSLPVLILALSLCTVT